MAQVVGQFTSNVVFTQGPFVLCDVNGLYRIGVEKEGCEWLAPLDISIYHLLTKDMNYVPGIAKRSIREPQVDWLNEQVRLGYITCKEGRWVY